MYIILIVCGYLADLTITTVAVQLGLGFTTYGALGFAVVFYLVGNEGVSVYTNAQKLGLPVPTFLSNIYNNFKLMAKTSVTRTNNEFEKGLKE
jgi:phage-related holin